MSRQHTVPCPACRGKAGAYEESSRQALDHNNETVTVYSRTWRPCIPCSGNGQIIGGRA
ncbi:hypothetical protein [Streptomyces sp. NPDC047070]|uniref:hypothetical protein n=1 Tax=Streptomyces sp. NPDC047070 TaxID=3154923 RepID=UPI0034545D6B